MTDKYTLQKIDDNAENKCEFSKEKNRNFNASFMNVK